MLNQWVVWLTVAGVAYAVGNQCDSEDARLCYDDLVNYETIIFPLYGENEAKLDDSCGNMNMSFNCIQSYAEICLGNEECDKNCTELIKEITSFLRITGLTKLYDNLCEKENALRQTYLENMECLEATADLYAVCHNISQESQHYMHTTKGANTVQASCCYLAWYRDCFTKVTRDNCGENATIAVSITAHYLLGDIAEQLCSSEPATCSKPPLPPGKELDIGKPDETDNEVDNTDKSTAKSKDDTDKSTAKSKDDTDKSTAKSKDDTDKSTATTLYASILIVLPSVFSILFKFAL